MYQHTDYFEKYGRIMQFNKNKTEPFHRWYSFVEGYSKEFIQSIIKEMNKDNLVCLEPFSGSGTTALELQNLGIPCYAFEINPLMYLIARVKLENRYEIRRFDYWYNYIKNKRIKQQVVLNTKFNTLYQGNGKKKWNYNIEVGIAVEKLKEAIESITEEIYKELFTVALAAILLDVSNLYRNGKCLSYKKNWEERKVSEVDVFTKFDDKVENELRNDIKKLKKGIKIHNKECLYNLDSRVAIEERIANNSIDLVITSPPYLNSRDYTDTYMLELKTLGFTKTSEEIKELREKTIRSHVQIKWSDTSTVDNEMLNRTLKELEEAAGKTEKWNDSIIDMVRLYFVDIKNIFRVLYSKMKLNGRIFFNVSNSAYFNVLINTLEICASIAEQEGFYVIEIRDARKLKTSPQQQKKLENCWKELLYWKRGKTLLRANNIFLPTLKRVKISNYSLYNCDIDYEFIEGLNLIIGGNGVGKTTFISIVKYALIGLYKKDLDVRVYKGEKRLIRGKYANCNTYFRNRTNEKETDKFGCVELWFTIDKTNFYVKRSLYNAQILEATYETEGFIHFIEGQSIRQDLYKGYELTEDNEKNINNLQYNYEHLVAKTANLADFDDFIFFVNQILLFGESRENVLWSKEVQERLLSSFLNDAVLEKKRKEYSLNAKYQDSLARHKQEEIKAIRRVLKQIEGVNSNKRGINELALAEEIERLEIKEENIQDVRDELEKKISSIYRKISELSHKINDKEREKEKIENQYNREYWPGINPKYTVYKRQYVGNKICPMCNTDLGDEQIIDEIGKCFFCHTSIRVETEESDELIKINEQLNLLMNERKEREKNISNYEQELSGLDSEYRKVKIKLFDKKNKMRLCERTENSNDKQNESSYMAMINRIDELKMDKEHATDLSEKYHNESQKIMSNIEENMIEITRNISDIFSEFAGAFMKLPCFLTLEKVKDSKIKLFLPVIDNKTRYDAEELSESQRFFVDYSFRMSILSFFYNCASFYICETPDSSLDISYEENAVDIFMKYLEKPNSLILTSNLNNSTFIKYVLKKASRKKVLNLLKYGKISKVQQEHEVLNELSKEIEEMCNE